MTNTHRLWRPLLWLAKRLKRRPSLEGWKNKALVAQGAVAAMQLRALTQLETLADAEFSIFSQWGEDGIIEWFVQNSRGIPERFVEFGVEDYKESDTHFLLSYRNWLVIDGSAENVDIIKSDAISWRHDLASTAAFINTDNINQLIMVGGLSGEIGILSIDLDGVDYWIWEAYPGRSVDRIVEYNAVYGDLLALVTPYDPMFVRGLAYPLHLYCGASIGALVRLGRRKGYTLVGSNRAGNNAFFVRDDRAAALLSLIADSAPRPSLFREGRDAGGHLSLVSGRARSQLIMGCRVIDVATGREGPLKSFGGIYGPRWGSVLN